MRCRACKHGKQPSAIHVDTWEVVCIAKATGQNPIGACVLQHDSIRAGFASQLLHAKIDKLQLDIHARMPHLRPETSRVMSCVKLYLDVGSELSEEGEGVVGHGVDLGALPIAGLATAGGGAHLRPTLVVGQSRLMHAAAGGHPPRRAFAALTERRPTRQSAACS